MKLIHIIMLALLLGRVQAQQDTAQPQIAHLTSASSSHVPPPVKTQDTYLQAERNRKASWYVSTDARTQHTSVIFLDSNQRILYEEVLPRQYVELTEHNRRVLDGTLAKLTNRQLMGDKLKTQPIRHENRMESLPVAEFMSDLLPENTPALHPTGTLAKVMVTENKLLYVWCKTPVPGKMNFMLRDYGGNILKFSYVKNKEFTDSFSLAHLQSGNYEAILSGKTWKNYYQIQVDQENQQIRVVPLVR